MLKVYNIGSDEMREATQEDIDDLQNACNKLSIRNNLIKAIANLNTVKDAEIINQLRTILKV